VERRRGPEYFIANLPLCVAKAPTESFKSVGVLRESGDRHRATRVWQIFDLFAEDSWRGAAFLAGSGRNFRRAARGASVVGRDPRHEANLET